MSFQVSVVEHAVQLDLEDDGVEQSYSRQKDRAEGMVIEKVSSV